uniref:Uncharacterized protein n=1 Tax=Salix viminalis TaxID=40686 RepID=A0A6N2LNN3_SALVM
MEKLFGSCSLAQNGKILNSRAFCASNQSHSNTWVYKRRVQQPELTPLQAQESEPEKGNEISPALDELSPNIYQPIAIRKGKGECTKKPLYPMANYVIPEILTFT